MRRAVVFAWKEKSISAEEWPKYDMALAKDENITLAVQVNGKLRDTLEVPAEISEAEAKAKALNSEKVQNGWKAKSPRK